MALGVSGGALFGLAGAPGMAADIPTLLALALRTIHRTAYCYGEDWRAPERRGLAIGVFALASANTLEEKQAGWEARSEEHTSELQSLMRNSYAVFCLKKKKTIKQQNKRILST